MCSTISPSASGAAAPVSRDGSEIMPTRLPNPADPNSANGSVPRAMVMMPLPAPYSTVKVDASKGPPATSAMTPIGFMSIASLAESSG
jgi:hypothetical protein